MTTTNSFVTKVLRKRSNYVIKTSLLMPVRSTVLGSVKLILFISIVPREHNSRLSTVFFFIKASNVMFRRHLN
jgi:hypothetical protein